MLVLLEVCHLFFVRKMAGGGLRWHTIGGSSVVWLCVLGVICAQAVITYLPSLQKIFGTVALLPADLAMIGGIGILFWIALVLDRILRRSIVRGIEGGST